MRVEEYSEQLTARHTSRIMRLPQATALLNWPGREPGLFISAHHTTNFAKYIIAQISLDKPQNHGFSCCDQRIAL
jgi:hypothetical protein